MVVDTPHRSEPGVASLQTRYEFRETVEGGVVRVLLTLAEDVGRDHGDADAITAASPSQHDGDSAVRSTLAWPDEISPLPTRLSSIAARLFTLRQLATVAASTKPGKTPSPTYVRLQSLGRSIDALAVEHRATEPPTVTRDELNWVRAIRQGLRKTKAAKAPARQAAAVLAAPPEQQSANAAAAGPSQPAKESTPTPPPPRVQPNIDLTRYLPELGRLEPLDPM